MCWQSISLKDPSSQELLDAVEHERNVRMNPSRNTTIFHHPTLGDFELQHVTAAAAMGRARQIARREGQRNRSTSTQGRQHFLVFSTHPNGASAGPNSPLVTVAEDASQLIAQPSSSGPSGTANQHETSSSNSQDRAGPSDLQSFSENLKTRLSSLSTRYKESITKSTRGWKERIFARNTSITETPPSTETRRVSSQSIATVSRMMDHLEIAEDGSRNVEHGLTANVTEEQRQTCETDSGRPLGEDDNTRAPCAVAAASSASN
ncbi:E3 ubiquitin-protein ligase rhf2a [Phtheirospermum japonicum]|uniref:E3 ubiquitin-protein ligase rhf2a n=1 Tax=Phtheirospermum japonicum TaxID=374723 RepID=A0A830BTX7_9LAMI|nr:E3 ubiquitin-protein ligase rhf2a [Phtheirospermum japonicum]